MPPCIEGSLRLSDQSTFYDSEYFGYSVEVTSGILEVCVNGTFLQMCNGSSTDLVLANTVCNSLEYDGQLMILSTFLAKNLQVCISCNLLVILNSELATVAKKVKCKLYCKKQRLLQLIVCYHD